MKLISRRNGSHARPLPRSRKEKFVPKFPVWKDEKLFGFISLRACLLVAGLGIMAFMVLMVWGFFKISDLSDKARVYAVDSRERSNENSKVIQQIQQLQRERHDERLEDQRRTDIKIRNVGCAAISLFPKGNKAGERLRKSFAEGGIKCPPLGKPFTPVPIPPPNDSPPSSSPRPDLSPKSSSSPTPSASVRPSSSVSSSPKGSLTRQPPTRTATKTVSSSPSRKPTLPGVPCVSLGVIQVNCP